MGGSLSSGPATPGVKGGAEKKSRYSGGCKKLAKNGLEKVPPAMAYANPCTVSCGDSTLTKLSTEKGSFPGMGVPAGCKPRIAAPSARSLAQPRPRVHVQESPAAKMVKG